MFPEISLHILDIAQNSLRAGATLIEILLDTDTGEHTLRFVIRDNGCGMTPEQVSRVTDPFYTSRTTRKVGLGVPFLKQAAEATGGNLEIHSREGSGTEMAALFHTDHIDCMPLGDITETMMTLIEGIGDVDLIYTYRVDGREFVLDTRNLREILGDVSFSAPEVRSFLADFLSENKAETDGGAQI